MNRDGILDRLTKVPGDRGFYYKNLQTGETLGLGENELFQAASVIKLPVYAAVQKLCREGAASMEETLLCREEDKMPSCGALQFFTGEIQADIKTLCSLMIALSDNTATNMLLRRFGLEALNAQFRQMGLEKTRLERLLFDAQAAAQGRENRVTPREMGRLLEQIYRREFLSEAVSGQMEALLLKQQIRHKIPGYLPKNIPVAHKTGEDSGITNDVGIVWGPEPFILCFAFNEADVPEAERAGLSRFGSRPSRQHAILVRWSRRYTRCANT